MTALVLKIIAILTMLIDHIGYTLAITYPYRVIGRIAFPIFAFLLTEGYTHTRNLEKYILRLALFAFISEIPFNLFTTGQILPHESSQNVFFTLLIAIFALYTLDLIAKLPVDKIVRFLISTMVVCIFCIMAELLGTDYGFYGVLTVLCFRYIKYTKRRCLNLITVQFLNILFFSYIRGFSSWSSLQFCALLSLIPIILYNGKKGFTPANPFLSKAMQLGFYVFYPLHMFILYIISL